MKKSTKTTLLALLTVLVVACGVMLVACNNVSPEDAINSYILDLKLVEDDFVLPSGIGADGAVAVTWESDRPDVIELVKRDDDYLAKVHQQDTLVQVNITVTTNKGGYSKTFAINVAALDVYTFSGKYVFINNRATVGMDFDLDTSYEVKGKTATISWEVGAGSEDYLAISGGNKCIVTVPQGDPAAVSLIATFSYAGETTNVTYKFTVAEEKDHHDYVDTIYTTENASLKLSGYVVAIHEASESYKNATFYMIDDDFCSGYYLYRVKMSVEDIAKMAEGVHVTITGDTTKNYNGLWENNGGGTAVVDEAPEGIPATINPRDHIYALDNDLIAGSPAAIYHESTLVSLTGWKVSRKPGSAPAAGATGTLFYLEKEGVEVSIAVSKYMAGVYETAAGDATWEALIALYDSVEVGDYYDITGILGYYNGSQIVPLSASDVKKSSADPAGTVYEGTAVKGAIAAVKDALAKADIDGTILANKEFTLPTSHEGVTISYRICGNSKSVTIDGGTIKVAPENAKENRKIEVIYTNGDYTTYTYFTLVTQNLSGQALVDQVKANLTNELETSYNTAATVTLPTGEEYDGVTIEWSIKEAVSFASIADGKLTISQPSEDSTFILVATIKLGDITDTKEITISVAAAAAIRLDPISDIAAGTYKYGLYQASLGKWLFATGGISTNNSGDFGATSEDPADAADFTLAQVTGGWTIQVNGKYLELNDNHRWALVDASTQAWVWNAEAKVLTFEVSGTVYYLGTYNSFDTISASAISYITGDNASKVGVSQFVAQFGTIVGSTTGNETPGGNTDTPSTKGSVSLDLVTGFATYASSWGSSYGAHELSGSALGAGSNISIAFSNANKQTSGNSIDDRPVVASKNGDSQYVTVSVTEGTISSIEFALKQWGSKVVNTLTLEYTTDGNTWTAISGVGFVGNSSGSFVANLASGNLPAGVTAVRLVVAANGSSNVQIGLSTISLVIA